MGTLSGQCLCGAVRYTTRGSPFLSYICHCESCRRATSAPLTGMLAFGRGQVTWHGERRFHRTSNGVTRGFCGTCGTALHFMTTRWPGEIHIHAGTLDDPTQFRPTAHQFWGARLRWLAVSDTLPKHPGRMP